jgi:dihydropteroate synthase
MQVNPVYDDVISEVHTYLSESVKRFVTAGCDPRSILVDPGIGFGKTTGHNLELIANLSAFKGLGAGLLLGVSRKRFIGELTGGLPVDQRVEGTIAACLLGWLNGADIFRVHDVPAVAKAFTVANAIGGRSKNYGH